MAQIVALVLLSVAANVPAAAGCDDDDRPATPISLKANPLGSGGIMLQWSSRAGHYDIYIRDKWGRPVPEAPDIVGGATNENYHEFYGLQPDKEYFFSMRARSEGGTQGCISKNASETVSAKTDSAEMNQHCKYYAQTAMEDVEKMRTLGCNLPDSTISGRWATREGTQFLYCLGEQRAGGLGDANYQWLRNQDIQACKDGKKAQKCTAYANAAVAAARQNRMFACGNTGARWTSSRSDHYSWCMGLPWDSNITRKEARARTARLLICREKRASTGQGSGGSGSACAGVPSDWSEMLKAHNDLRGQYCGVPLTWNCDLATQAQAYAEKCILDTHGASGENMADMWSSDDKYPAGSDSAAFESVWGCEKTEYHFDAPEIVGGFKKDCHTGANGGKPVNGHFTQIVWRANTVLGCGRAKCPMTDADGKVHQGTHWVCRFLPGGNDPGSLTQNVKQPPCGNTFHSLSVPSCFRGMVLTASGACACPPGRRWNGRMCVERRSVSTPATTSPDTCPRSRPIGTPPNCCPEGTAFDGGVCRTQMRSTPAPACTGDRPVGTYPNCCPRATSFSDGVCRSEGSGTSAPRCTGERPVGTYPNCCPPGTFFSDGMCRTGSGRTNGTQPGDSGICPRSRPVGSPPNCCPKGTVFRGGLCGHSPTPGTGGGGTNGNSGNPTTKPPVCDGSRPIGTPPNCCPRGTHLERGACRRDAVNGGKQDGGTQGTKPCPAGTHATRSGQCEPNASPSSKPTPSKPEPSKAKCTGGRRGTPPNCFCVPPSRFIGGRCRRISKPTPTGPSPTHSCPSGMTGPKCDKIIVH